MQNIQRFISLKQLKQIVPYSSMQIYRLEKEGSFPRRIKIGKHRVAWLEADVQKWIESKLPEKNHVEYKEVKQTG